MEQNSKICTACQVEKNLELFFNSSIGKLGKTSKCKDCIKLQNKDYSKNYYQKNKKRLLEKQKQYNKDNSEHIKQYHKRYYKKDN